MASGFSVRRDRATHCLQQRSGRRYCERACVRARNIYRDRPAARRTAAGAKRYTGAVRGARVLLCSHELSQLFRALNTRAARPAVR